MRSLKFIGRTFDRYWWFNNPSNNYIPPIYSFLTDEEWNVIEEWYDETDANNMFSECNIPLISMLQGMIMGNGLSSVLQFGTSVGYSTLLIGFMFRHMGKKNSFVTIDNDPAGNEFTQKYMDKAGLNDYVKLILSNSSDTNLPEQCLQLIGTPELIFIDSSHQYAHTLEELNLWYNYLKCGGLIFLHDSSDNARAYDSTQQGGVKRALVEWYAQNHSANYININPCSIDIDLTYQDGCGLAIIHKN